MNKKPEFPKDFVVTENSQLDQYDCIQYVYPYYNPLFSAIIGKYHRIASNGVSTYEFFDFNTNKIYEDVTKDEINQIINQIYLENERQ